MAADSTQKRRRIAEKAIVAAQQYVDALNTLVALNEEKKKLDSPFVDADFVTDGLRHLTAGMVDTFFVFVVPTLQANFLDTANGNRNQQLLLQLNPGGPK